MRANFFLKSKIDAVSCISGLKRLKSRAAWYVRFLLNSFSSALVNAMVQLVDYKCNSFIKYSD